MKTKMLDCPCCGRTPKVCNVPSGHVIIDQDVFLKLFELHGHYLKDEQKENPYEDMLGEAIDRIDNMSESQFVQALKDAVKDYPYLIEESIETIRKYNPDYGDDRMCKCGHPYHRHFDSYGGEMDAVGCKYCDCYTFEEATNDDA